MIDLNATSADYLEYCEKQKRLSNKTIKAYTSDIAQFLRFAQELDYTEKKIITDYIAHLHKTFSSKSAKRKLASIKAFYAFMIYDERIQENPFYRINTKFQEPQVLPKTIPLPTIKRILGIAYNSLTQANTEYSIYAAQRDIAVLELLFATGMRVSELCSLNICDVDLDNGVIYIMGKGTKERSIQIGNNDVHAILCEYKKTHLLLVDLGDEEKPFFINRLQRRLSDQSVRFMIKSICAKAAVSQHVTPHMFRHSFATLLLEEDVDIRYIQQMLGHNSIKTTQIYTQVTLKKQRQILSEKHPRNKLSFDHKNV